MRNRILLLFTIFWIPLLAYSQTCNWDRLNRSSHKQVEGQNVVINDKLYVFYGFVNITQITNTVEVYDPNSGWKGTWTSLASMIVPVTHVDVLAVDDEAWLIGGFKGNHGGPSTDTVQIYNPATNSWRLGPTLPSPHASGASVLLGRKIHVMAGLLPDRSTGTGKHYVYDLENPSAGWDTLAPHPNPRNHMGGVSMKGRIYTVGGQTGHDGPAPTQDYKSVEMYDPTTDSWTSLPPLDVERSHIEPGTFSKDGLIYINGGNTINLPALRLDIVTYNPENGQTSFVCNMPDYYTAAAAKIIGDKYFMAHGGQYGYINPIDTCWSFNINRNKKFDLGFWPKKVQATLAAGSTADLESLIYTVTGETNYSLNTGSAPSWLKSVNTSSNSTLPTGEEVKMRADASNLSLGTYSFELIANASGFNPDTLEIELVVNGGPVFAVDLLDFSAEMSDDETTRLKWTTQREINNDYFSVERRFASEQNFQTLGRVSSLGESSSFTPYSFVDQLSEGTREAIYYRLRIVDVEGNYSYSDIVSVVPTNGEEEIRVFPNPVSENLYVELFSPYTDHATLYFYDLSGKLIMPPRQLRSENGAYFMKLNTQNFKPGYYLLKVETEQGSHVRKVVVK